MTADRRLVIVANRLPVHRSRTQPGGPWLTSPGGLVSALAPILRRRGGSWVGWTGTPGPAPEPFEHERIRIRPVPLSAAEVESFYNGFSNRTLWPLYHDAVKPPEIRREWWWPYVEINGRFASAAAEAAGDDGVIWVQDYHLQLAPRMIREHRPRARVGFFLHTPFPPDEIFAWLPWRRQILEGLLGADLLGFQTETDAEQFMRAAHRFVDAKVADGRVEFEGRTVRVGVFPISIDVGAFERLASDPGVRARAQQIREGFGAERKVILCVDRLDYTKGIEARLAAFQEVLRRKHTTVMETLLVQVAVPSRETVRAYAATRHRVERLVGRINGQFSEPGRVAVHYYRRSLSVRELVAFYIAADIMLVTPLRDGMNLVAKEYVATRLSGDGTLVLSEFAGAARELTRALMVNPYDVDGIAATLDAALRLPEGEVRSRMASLREVVKTNDVYRWADSLMEALPS